MQCVGTMPEILRYEDQFEESALGSSTIAATRDVSNLTLQFALQYESVIFSVSVCDELTRRPFTLILLSNRSV